MHSYEGQNVNKMFICVSLFTEITISFFGESRVHWKTGGRYPTHYRASQVYINSQIKLWGTGNITYTGEDPRLP